MTTSSTYTHVRNIWDFLMVEQIFLSPQVKQKRDYCCNLPHKSSIKLLKCKDLHDTHREKASSNETRSSANKKYKYRHLGCWYNQVQKINSL